MKTKIYLIAIASISLCLLILARSASPSHQGNQPDTYLIENVHLIEVADGTITSGHSVLIKAGQIQSILPANDPKIEPKVPKINAQGGFLMPGLIDMHVHAYDPGAFQLTLSHGVTHVRVMNGVPAHLKWRQEQARGERLASGMSVSSPIIHSGGDWPLSWRADTADEARALVGQAKNTGYDLIKAYGSMNAEALNALIDEAEVLGIPVAKHGPHAAPGMAWQPLQRLQSLEHVEDIYQGLLHHRHDLQALPEIAAKLHALNVPITPTLNIFWQLTQISDQQQAFIDQLPTDYISPIIRYEDRHNQVNRWLESSEAMVAHNHKTLNFLQQITQALAQSGVTLLVGSDSGVLLSPHGLATLNEMRLMKAAGLSNLQVIQAATIDAAKALNRADELGQIKPHATADLLLLRHNPLQDLAALDEPLAVIKGGVWLDQDELLSLRQLALDNRSFLAELWLLMNN